jgi:hypothetical protein
MEFESYNFPELTLIKLISPLTNTFKIKTPKLSINRTLKSMKIPKEDGITESEEEKISKKIYTIQEQNLKNTYNMNLYKNLPPSNILVYTDNENDAEELKLLGQPINYDYLVKMLQSDMSNIENFFDEKNGVFLDKKNENHFDFKKLTYIPEPKNSNDAKIIFDSKFESGNLRMAIKLNSDIDNEYDLIIRKDYNCEKNYSWFFFSIECDRECDIKFNILNFIKKKIMFDEKEKIRILVYNEKDKWTRNTYNVQYYENNIKILASWEDKEKMGSNDEENIFSDKFKEDEKNNDMFKLFDKDKGEKEDIPDTEFFFTLSFCYHVNKNNINTPIYFALCFPYTYSTLQDYLHKLSVTKTNKNKIKFSTLNKTICGNPLDILYISNFASTQSLINARQCIIFTARVHPGETSGSYVIESVINNLLNNSEQSNNLLDKYIFKIIPMLNPDGVIHGHYRNNILGKDLNRMWQDPRDNETPTIYYLKKLISINKPFFFCDFHGHSNMPNCALYCCSPPKKKKNKFFNFPNGNIKSYHFYEEKVFMRIMEEEAKYYQKSGEKYNIQKSKLKSARGVIYNEFNVYYSYALETGLMAKWNKQNILGVINNNLIVQLEPSTINEYYQIGTDYVNSFIKWNTKTKFYSVLKKIRDEEESKKLKDKEKDKDKDKDKELNFLNNNKEVKNKRKVIKISKMNSLKPKDIYKEKGNKILSKTDKMSEKKIKESTIINSMLIYPKLLKENITKFEQLMPKEINEIKNEQ